MESHTLTSVGLQSQTNCNKDNADMLHVKVVVTDSEDNKETEQELVLDTQDQEIRIKPSDDNKQSSSNSDIHVIQTDREKLMNTSLHCEVSNKIEGNTSKHQTTKSNSTNSNSGNLESMSKSIVNRRKKRDSLNNKMSKSKFLKVLNLNLEKEAIETDEEDISKVVSKRYLQSGSGLLKRARKDLTFDEKLDIFQQVENGVKNAEIAKKYGISVSTISRMKSRKEYYVLLCSNTGSSAGSNKRIRESKDPELDRALFRWYTAIEDQVSVGGVNKDKLVLSNSLLKEKSKELATFLGRNYLPTEGWIKRWKRRHGLSSKNGFVITEKDELIEVEKKINLSEVLDEADVSLERLEEMRIEMDVAKATLKKKELLICEHCGITTTSDRKAVITKHIEGCPSINVRKDLTLEEKGQIVNALEKPGVKMVNIANKFGVSPSTVSRINTGRIDILARQASGDQKSSRKRDRKGREPEVERALCIWYKREYGKRSHLSASLIKNKAKAIAAEMGKSFLPSDSWVFRWRHRNNIHSIEPVTYESDENGNNLNNDDVGEETKIEGLQLGKDFKYSGSNSRDKRKQSKTKDIPTSEKKPKKAKSLMCDKCGFVSSKFNIQIRSIRHAKGCPDIKSRNEVTYDVKAKMVKTLDDPGATLSSVARQFGVSVSSMSRMKLRKDEILSKVGGHRQQKRLRDCKEPEVALALYEWYTDNMTEGISLTGKKLRDKACSLAAERGREFRVSSGWLARWKQRYNVESAPRPIKPSIENKSGDTIKNMIPVRTMNNNTSDKKIGNILTNDMEFSDPEESSESHNKLLEGIISRTGGGDNSLQNMPHLPQSSAFVTQRFSKDEEDLAPLQTSSLWAEKEMAQQQTSLLQQQIDGDALWQKWASYMNPNDQRTGMLKNMQDSYPSGAYQVPTIINSELGDKKTNNSNEFLTTNLSSQLQAIHASKYSFSEQTCLPNNSLLQNQSLYENHSIQHQQSLVASHDIQSQLHSHFHAEQIQQQQQQQQQHLQDSKPHAAQLLPHQHLHQHPAYFLETNDQKDPQGNHPSSQQPLLLPSTIGISTCNDLIKPENNHQHTSGQQYATSQPHIQPEAGNHSSAQHHGQIGHQLTASHLVAQQMSQPTSQLDSQLSTGQPLSSVQVHSQVAIGQLPQHQHSQLTSHPSQPIGMLDEKPGPSSSKLMEALRMMSSFAHEKSLGTDVQNALKTIELSMKGSSSTDNSHFTS